MKEESSSDLNAELLDDFFAEADEHLLGIRQGLIHLEPSVGKAQPDPKIVEDLFRNFHSFKGISAIVGLGSAEALIVTTSGQACAIPQSFVREILHTTEAEIQKTNNLEGIPYRAAVLPVVRLADLFKLKSEPNLQFIVTASTANSVLQFGTENQTNYFGLDDVSVTPIPPVAFQSAFRSANDFNLRFNTASNLIYQVQYTTNFSQPVWINLGLPILALGSSISITDTNSIASSSQRFYRLMVTP